MGIKFLNLHVIPWCFHLMGNPISCVQFQPEPPLPTIKLIKSDGVVKIYDRPIKVSRLMMEFPKHLVCRSDSLYIGQKIPPLSADDQLQLGHNYFLLPKHFFQSVLSFVTIASFASPHPHPHHQATPLLSPSSSRHSRNAFLKKVATCQPFDIQKSPSGCLRIRLTDEFISQLMEEGKIKDDEEDDDTLSSSGKSSGGLCNTPQLQKEYTQLVRSHHWKPKLETIKEKEKRKLSSSFGMKRRKKSPSKGAQKIQRSDHNHFHVTSTKPLSKTKIKIKSRK